MFTVYADTKPNRELNVVLENAYKIIERCELHDPEYRFDIFLAHNNIFNKIENLQGKGVAARVTAGNIIFKVPIDARNNIALSPRSVINLTELLVHEMVHILQTHKYGILKFNPLNHPPMWKLEGYPEYVSKHDRRVSEHYELKSEVRRFIQLDKGSKDGFVEVTSGHYMPAIYYKGRIMTEYLIDIKGYTYDQIFHGVETEETIFEEMMAWAELQ